MGLEPERRKPEVGLLYELLGLFIACSWRGWRYLLRYNIWTPICYESGWNRKMGP